MATTEKEKLTPAERSQEHAQRIAELLIKQLQENRAPWQIPWEKSNNVISTPINGSTNKPYRGMNHLYLWATAIENGWNQDNRWLTYRQAEALGAQVRKGEKGTTVVYPATHLRGQ